MTPGVESIPKNKPFFQTKLFDFFVLFANIRGHLLPQSLNQTAVLCKQWAFLILYKRGFFHEINVLPPLAFSPVVTTFTKKNFQIKDLPKIQAQGFVKQQLNFV